jgi:4-hydroxybenzoyl-CoA thioesterase
MMPKSEAPPPGFVQTSKKKTPAARHGVEARCVLRGRVDFGDCDPAGIAFAPRYFETFARAFESFYADELGVDRQALINERRIGFPYVSLSCQYFSALTYGDEIEILLSVDRIGRSSFYTTLHVFHDGHEAARGQSVNVTISLDTFKAIAIPNDIRQALQEYQSSCDDPGIVRDCE